MKHVTTKIFCKEKNKGFGLVEMLIGASVLSVTLLSIATFFQVTTRASRTTQSAIQADYLLEEGVEALKIFRDMSYTNNFSKISTSTPYYYQWNGTAWVTSTAYILIDGKFERSFTLADVQRDANNDIASSGTYDPDTKLAKVSVSWSDASGTTTRSIQTYITNIFGN